MPLTVQVRVGPCDKMECVKIPALFSSTANGSDYVLDSSTVTFQSGMTVSGTTECVQITITDDDCYEENEEFIVKIVSIMPPSAAVNGTPSEITKTIQDNNGRNSGEPSGHVRISLPFQMLWFSLRCHHTLSMKRLGMLKSVWSLV